MRSLPRMMAILACTPAAASDFDLMVGLRSTIASSIQDSGYACADVTAIDPVGFEGSAGVLRVLCRSGDPSRSGRLSAFRVTAFPDGDFWARPWGDTAP